MVVIETVNVNKPTKIMLIKNLSLKNECITKKGIKLLVKNIEPQILKGETTAMIWKKTNFRVFIITAKLRGTNIHFYSIETKR